MGTREEELLVQRERQEREGHRTSADSNHASCEHYDCTTDHWDVATVR